MPTIALCVGSPFSCWSNHSFWFPYMTRLNYPCALHGPSNVRFLIEAIQFFVVSSGSPGNCFIDTMVTSLVSTILIYLFFHPTQISVDYKTWILYHNCFPQISHLYGFSPVYISGVQTRQKWGLGPTWKWDGRGWYFLLRIIQVAKIKIYKCYFTVCHFVTISSFYARTNSY